MTSTPEPVRGRLAPSPTGRLHLGNAFAFLSAWLSVRQQGGTLVLRMEDIDPDRSREDFAKGILEDLNWLGLDWDEGPDKGGPFDPYVQSERLDRYAAVQSELAARGLVYPCFCTRKELRMLASAPHIGDEGVPYPGTCRRLASTERAFLERNGRRACSRLDTAAASAALDAAGRDGKEGGARKLAFEDGVLGLQEHSLQGCGGDFALRRSDGVVAYQLAVAVDDAAMNVSEIVRGDDLLLSTPRQILLFRLFGKEPPRYAHVPLVHDHQGERLAKRHQALELASLRSAGVRPEAVVGFLAYLAGWIERPEIRHPAELTASFCLPSLSRRHLQLPEKIFDTLLYL